MDVFIIGRVFLVSNKINDLFSVQKGIKYLVKWAGYSAFDNTWEPRKHLSAASLEQVCCVKIKLYEQIMIKLKKP